MSVHPIGPGSAGTPPELPAVGVLCTRLPDLARGPWRFHIVGIGGAGMSAIATVLLAMGHGVSGSDMKGSAVLSRLQALGATVHVGHDPRNVAGADAVASSSAVPGANAELEQARRAGVPTFSRADVLEGICRQRRLLAVSGTHGKTTTTAMLASVMVATGTDPSYLVGGDILGEEGGARWGGGPWLVVEADESDGTFLRLPAEAAVVTSVAPDHLDYYGSFERLQEAFGRFLERASGPRVVCADDPGAAALVGALRGDAVLTYGTSLAAAYRVHDLSLEGTTASFGLEGPGGLELGRFALAVPGLHNVLDATAAVVTGMAAGATVAQARGALAAYSGVRRRFELRGRRDGITYVDDYAHNPGKIEAVLAAAKGSGLGRVVAVFQPHRYSRTEALWQELGQALTGADVVVVTGVYGAGEAPRPGVTGELIAREVHRLRPEIPVVHVSGGRAELVEHLHGVLEPGDLCLSVGAGDITTLAGEMLAGGPTRPPTGTEEGPQ